MYPDGRPPSPAFDVCLLLLIAATTAAAVFGLSPLYPGIEWLELPVLQAGYVGVALLLLLLFWASPWLRRCGDIVVRSSALIAAGGSLVLLPLIIAKQQEAVSADIADSQIEQQRKEVRLMRARQLQQERAALREEVLAQPQDRFSRYTGEIPATELLALRQVDEEMRLGLEEFAAAYRASMDANPTRGPADWLTFPDRERLRAEIAAHRAVLATSTRLRDFVAGFEGEYTARLDALQLSEISRRVGIAELRRILQQWESENLQLLRELDTQMIETATEALQLLDFNWGRWSYNPRDNDLSFEQSSAEVQFAELLFALEAISTEMSEMTPADKQE